MSGTLNIALSQQVDGNGTPIAGAMLFFYQVGTVATPQNSYQDFGLTIANPNPLLTDQYGRIPMFYLADGPVHVRLTDANGVVIFDYPTMQVVGPSSGSGGGGSVDPTTIFSTGDFKWRPTAETLSGWVKANAQTIGSAISGASQRANADTQNLFVYLWNNFADYQCPVSGGRGANGAADFSANKTIQLPDLRSMSPFGLDNMGNVARGLIQQSNIFSDGGTDTQFMPYASGGEANHTLSANEMPAHNHPISINDPGHSHDLPGTYLKSPGSTGAASIGFGPVSNPNTDVSTTGIGASAGNVGGGVTHNNMPPFVLGTWFLKL